MKNLDFPHKTKFLVFALGLVATLLGLATSPALTVVGVLINTIVMFYQFLEDQKRDTRLKEKKLEFEASAWVIERNDDGPIRARLRIEPEDHGCGEHIIVRTEQVGLKKLDLKAPEIDDHGGITIYNSCNNFFGEGIPIIVYVAGRG
jgi:hypothetical protein